MLKRKSKKADAKEQPGKRRVSASNQQGIVASSNALLRVAALSLAVMLLAIGLGFAYLLLLREPALQQAQIDRVAESFSAQQATNIQHLLTGLEERMRGAARSPSPCRLSPANPTTISAWWKRPCSTTSPR